MVRSTLAAGLVLPLLAVAAARAELDADYAPLPAFDYCAARAAAARALPARNPAPAPRSRADLFAFTRAEARAARERFSALEAPERAGLTFDDAVPADIRAQLLADLAFISSLRGGAGTPLHRRIFGPVDGAAYARFFSRRIRSVGMDDCGDADAVACVIPMKSESTMWLTRNYARFSRPQIARLMVLFHEARHAEPQNGNWPHADCPTPFLDSDGRPMTSVWTGAPLAGKPACDDTPLGSYGSSTIMLKNIQLYCAGCSDKTRMDAGFYADDQLGRIINPEARREMQEDFAR